MSTRFSTIDRMTARARAEGEVRVRVEGIALQLKTLLSRHAKRRWGPPPEEIRSLLETIAARAGAEQLVPALSRFPEARSWTELVAGIVPPETEPADPEWLVPFKF